MKLSKKTETETTETAVETGTRAITIQGVMFKIPNIYAAGHVVTKQEAEALNQTRAEGIRNNCATLVKKAKEGLAEGAELSADVIEALTEAVATYASEYTFSGNTGRLTDPIDAESKLIAAQILDGQIVKNGMTIKEYKEAGKYGPKLAELMAMESIRNMAVERVRSRTQLAGDIAL